MASPPDHTIRNNDLGWVIKPAGNDSNFMQKSQQQPAKAGFGPADVLYVLFKHKWLILLLSLLGLGAAATVFLKQEPLYVSQAQLLVKYVRDSETVDQYQSQLAPGSAKADNVMSTQIAILTSTNLALEVAEKIGIDRILPDAGGNGTPSAAAGAILKNLVAGIGQSYNVLHIMYGNKDPELASEVLEQVVKSYKVMHREIHRPPDSYERVAEETQEVHERLQKTEQELNEIRTANGVLSLDEAISEITVQRVAVLKDLMGFRTELADREATISALETAMGVQPADESVDEPGDPAPTEAITEYRTVMELLAFYQKAKVELRIKYKQGNPILARNQREIAKNEAKRRELIAKHPKLVAAAEVIEKDSTSPKWNLVREKASLYAIQSKIDLNQEFLKELTEQFRKRYVIGAKIEKLVRKREMEDEEYRSNVAKLKNATIDHNLDSGQMPNIRAIDDPTEPVRTYDAMTKKLIFGLAGGGIALGLGLSFLIELLFDRRVKRPIEIQARLQLPLLLTIPYLRDRNRGRLVLDHGQSQPKIANGNHDLLLQEPVEDEITIGGPTKRTGHFILPYSETIRDRIIFNFEVNNVKHKPKLVAVTGLSDGAGSSTIAAGLAKSFSDISGTKVLLVDLSSYHPEENLLFGEIRRHSLNSALHLAKDKEFKNSSQSLYYASATARRDDSGISTFSPVHLYELMPHLEASEYDYIIFDMPPVDQTSRTLTMAGLMDKVLLVLDAENTSRDGLMWGYSELIKGRADVSCIFNKTRSHVPGWLAGNN